MAKKRPKPKPKPTAPAEPGLRDRVKAFRRVRAGDLAPNPLNWRTHPEGQSAALRGLLAEVGFAGAVLAREQADGTLQLIDGHLRVGTVGHDTEIPVLVLDVTEAEAAKILATYDPLGAMAGADSGKLDELLRGVQTSSDAVRAMLEQLAGDSGGDLADVADPEGGGDGYDATPSEDGPTRTQPGDLWVIGRHRLLVGDCTSAANLTRLCGVVVPAIMVTDPPYGVEYDPTWRHKAGINKSARTGAVSNDDRADWSEAWRLFPGNVAYVWHGALHGPTVFTSLASAGFTVRAQLVWAKPRLVLGRGHFHWKHEPAFVATKGEADETQIEGELAYYAVRKGSSGDWQGGRKQTTVWEIGFAGETKTHHGTQKPVECMARPIRNHGRPGDVVYDPFLGSGTTLIAAHRLGRTCYGCELDPKYADVILKRAEAEGLTCEKVV